MIVTTFTTLPYQLSEPEINKRRMRKMRQCSHSCRHRTAKKSKRRRWIAHTHHAPTALKHSTKINMLLMEKRQHLSFYSITFCCRLLEPSPTLLLLLPLLLLLSFSSFLFLLRSSFRTRVSHVFRFHLFFSSPYFLSDFFSLRLCVFHNAESHVTQ